MATFKKIIERKNTSNSDKEKGSFNFSWTNILILLIILIIFLYSKTPSNIEEITLQKFQKEMLLNHDIAKVNIINKEIVEVYIKKGSLKNEKYKKVAKDYFGNLNKGPHYTFRIGSVEVFESQMSELQSKFKESEKISIQYMTRENSWFSTLLNWLVPLILLGFFWFFIMNRIASRSGGMFDFGKSNPRLFDTGTIEKITFNDVAGYEEAKVEIMEIVEFLKHPETFTKLGAKIPKGILLVGAPGTGKTLLAKAIAGEAGVPFFSLSGPEFIEMFVGVGASRVRDLFDKAKKSLPSIIFIDEIDTIGRVRGKIQSIQVNDERDSTLNQLLAEMDGFDPTSGLIVLAATNRGDILDPALLRPGRFDRHIHLDLPNKQERLAIFNVHLKPLTLEKKVEAESLASQTPGFSGADIANVCNEAALIAARKKKKVVEQQDFFDAIERIITGLEKKSKIISPSEKKIIAYHEAGHAVVSWMLENVDPLMKVSIIPHGRSLGGTWYLPEERQITTRSQFYDILCATLAGRTAEEIVFNDISSGALDDLEKVTKQAYSMVAQLGFSDKIGNISFYDSTGIYENSFQKPFSEDTAKMIDDEVRKIVEKAHQSSKVILEKNREKLDILASLLIQKEVVYIDELKAVLGEKNRKSKMEILPV